MLCTKAKDAYAQKEPGNKDLDTWMLQNQHSESTQKLYD